MRRSSALAAVMLSLVAGCGAPAEPTEPARVAAVCSDPLNDDDGHCALELKDSDRRTVVPAIGRDEALDEAAVEVHRLVHEAGGGELSATEADVAKVRRALAGYAGATVRLARDADPSAPGALIYAVRVGEVCVVGDVTPPPVERMHEWYAGLLPEGRCLTP